MRDDVKAYAIKTSATLGRPLELFRGLLMDRNRDLEMTCVTASTCNMLSAIGLKSASITQVRVSILKLRGHPPGDRGPFF